MCIIQMGVWFAQKGRAALVSAVELTHTILKDFEMGSSSNQVQRIGIRDRVITYGIHFVVGDDTH